MTAKYILEIISLIYFVGTVRYFKSLFYERVFDKIAGWVFIVELYLLSSRVDAASQNEDCHVKKDLHN